MKKTILLFTLFMSMGVLAKEYTDYEYKYTQTTVPLVDEFTKYETVTIHKYYSLKENKIELDKYDSRMNTCEVQPNPLKVLTYTSVKPDNYESERLLKLRFLDKYDIESFTIGNILPSTQNISKMVVKIGDVEYERDDVKKLYTITEVVGGVPIDDLEIVLHYNDIGGNNLSITLNGRANEKFVVTFKLDKNVNKMVIKPMYKDTVKTLGLANEKIQYLYRYTKETYTCTNYEKVYYEDSEVPELEGYIYDSSEDEKLYKVYKRTAIEEIKPEEPEPEEPEPEEPEPEEPEPEEPEPEEPKPEEPEPEKPEPEEPEPEEQEPEEPKPKEPEPEEPKPDEPQLDEKTDEKNVEDKLEIQQGVIKSDTNQNIDIVSSNQTNSDQTPVVLTNTQSTTQSTISLANPQTMIQNGDCLTQQKKSENETVPTDYRKEDTLKDTLKETSNDNQNVKDNSGNNGESSELKEQLKDIKLLIVLLICLEILHSLLHLFVKPQD